MIYIEPIKKNLISFLRQTKTGNNIFFGIKHKLGRVHMPDMSFPELISIEIASACNISCVHCPPQIRELSSQRRKHSIMDLDTFRRLMDEVDKFGPRRIALHKDGEPLLHPQIIDILKRVKQNNEHNVYLTTNAIKLSHETGESILENRIDIVNFSIGAATEKFYEKVRGKGYGKMMGNIHHFLELVESSDWKPKVLVQIINLPEFPEMEDEIQKFKQHWSKFKVEIEVWDKLTWGTFEPVKKLNYRYPCYSLWDSFNINSNGVVTACCMDWTQGLKIGDIKDKSIHEIWHDGALRKLRELHIAGKENELPPCAKCNYWEWQPMLKDYPL